MTEGRPEEGRARDAEAADWLVRLGSDDAGEADWRAHEAWLAADPANVSAYARAEALWAELDDQAGALLRGLDAAAGASPATVVPFPARRPPLRRRALPGWAAAAAAVLLVVSSAGLVTYLEGRPVAYSTAPGQLRRIALADGTRIELNGGSRLTVGLGHAARRVRMADAEASFDVTHDPGRPFLISVGDERIRVIGTAFDVSHHDGRLAVTVRRGVVEVARRGPAGGLSQVVRVPAGFQLVRMRGQPATVIRQVDPDEAFAWREGRLVYHDQRLAVVAADLNRAFPTPVVVQGPARDLRFSGVLVLDDEGAVVRRLAAFLPLDAHRSDDAIVLSSRP